MIFIFNSSKTENMHISGISKNKDNKNAIRLNFNKLNTPLLEFKTSSASLHSDEDIRNLNKIIHHLQNKRKHSRHPKFQQQMEHSLNECNLELLRKFKMMIQGKQLKIINKKSKGNSPTTTKEKITSREKILTQEKESENEESLEGNSVLGKSHVSNWEEIVEPIDTNNSDIKNRSFNKSATVATNSKFCRIKVRKIVCENKKENVPGLKLSQNKQNYEKCLQVDKQALEENMELLRLRSEVVMLKQRNESLGGRIQELEQENQKMIQEIRCWQQKIRSCRIFNCFSLSILANGKKQKQEKCLQTQTVKEDKLQQSPPHFQPLVQAYQNQLQKQTQLVIICLTSQIEQLNEKLAQKQKTSFRQVQKNSKKCRWKQVES